MPRTWKKELSSLAAVVLFAFALWGLYYQLEGHRYEDVLEELHRLPGSSILTAAILTLLSYWVQTGYDWLAFRALPAPLPYRTIAPISFIAYAFSNTLGYAVLTAGSIRYRLYTALGISGLQVAEIIMFCGLTFWLGLLTVSGAIFLLPGAAASSEVSLGLRLLGATFVLAVLAYLAVLYRAQGKTIPIRGHEITLPPFRLAPAQLLVSSLDWLLAASVVYALLHQNGLSLPHFLASYFLAQTAALASGLPGGVGVFEGLVVLSLSPTLPADAVLGALLAYRAIYYLAPFVIALLLLLYRELGRYRQKLSEVHQRAGVIWQLTPSLFAFTTFVAGTVLLFSGALPAMPGRMRELQAILPLPVIEFSHFLGSLAGVTLIILARGIQLRLRVAHAAAAALLGAGVIFSLFKGLDYEEATILAVMLVLLLSARRSFYRSSSLMSQPFSRGWVIAVCLAIGCTAWLGLFAYRHVDYSSQLWWQFSLTGDAPRSLRGMVAVSAFALLFALAKLLRPESPKPTPPSQSDFEKVSALVSRSKSTLSKLALLGDKQFLFSQNCEAFVMYGVWGDSWIALGDPVGPEKEWPDLVWEFRQQCDRAGDRTVFYQVAATHVPLYLDLGLALLKLGEEARVDLSTFSLDGAGRKGLRHTRNHLEKQGCRFEIVPPETSVRLLPEMEAVSNAWLRSKNTREKSFSLGRFDRHYLSYFPTAIVQQEGRLLAFANLWQGAEKEELSIDLMRHQSDSVEGLMDYLFINLMLWGKAAGFRFFNLGMAPLSGFREGNDSPIWNRIAGLVYRHGEHFYNFQGLRHYKEKFDPVWQPRYLASPGGLSTIQVLANLTALISGGMRGVVGK